MRICFGLCIGLALMLACHANAAGRQMGLRVDKSGTILRDGKPFRGIGVNYFDLFARTLKDPKDTSYREGLKVLKDHGIPFARFMACGYWPVDNALYLKDKKAYFKLMDGVVKSAEEQGIGLIPSFFFHYATVPDIVGEPIDQWGNPASKTIAFMRQYTRDIVTRYRNSPAIWAWEFGNEIELQVDLPNPSEHRAPVWPTLGTAKSRGEHDDLTSDMARFALKAFAEEVRKYDKSRPILSGDAFPRGSAWHLRENRSWEQDSEGQYAEMLLDDSPNPVDTLCVHLYNDALGRFGRTLSYEELLKTSLDIAAKAHKPLVVGEFGSDESAGAKGRADFEAMLSAIEKTGVALAALWVYDFKGQDGTFNVTVINNKSYQLDAISQANKRLLNRG